MNQNFSLEVAISNNQPQILFANNSKDFVEVIFSSEGKELKTGQPTSAHTRGYCYPPGHSKAITKLKNGSILPLDQTGKVKAEIFAGQALRKADELDVPTFIWRKMQKKTVTFQRDSDVPMTVLEVPY